MDSEILDQLTNLEKNVDSEVTKPKRGRKKESDSKINEVEENDVREKRERLQSVSWSLAEFRHNKIVQSPHENYFNVCRQHKEK